VPRPLRIVDYDHRWPNLEGEERDSIIEVAGSKILAIENIGITVVPGLAAKPIIDIMAGVEHAYDADESVFCEPLATTTCPHSPRNRTGTISWGRSSIVPDTPCTS